MPFWEARPSSLVMLTCAETRNGNVWFFLNGRVLNVSAFSSQHPDHSLDVFEKYASDADIGDVGGGKAKKVRRALKPALTCASDKDDADASEKACGDWRMEAYDGEAEALTFRSYRNACCYLILDIIYDMCRGFFCKEFRGSRLTEQGLREVPPS